MGRPKYHFDPQSAQIISRDAASMQGLTRYYTGMLCANGHLAPRFVANSGCVDCAKPKQQYRPNVYDSRVFWTNQVLIPPDTPRMAPSRLYDLSKILQTATDEFFRKFEK